jgi:hypothetical protein
MFAIYIAQQKNVDEFIAFARPHSDICFSSSINVTLGRQVD